MLLDENPTLPVSGEAVETFIARSDVAARDLLRPYGDAVIVLSTVLRIKRTLDGAGQDHFRCGSTQGVGDRASTAGGLA